MSLFKDKTLLITGGTGSFGNAVLNRFLQTDIGEIRIFSRDVSSIFFPQEVSNSTNKINSEKSFFILTSYYKFIIF